MTRISGVSVPLGALANTEPRKEELLF